MKLWNGFHERLSPCPRDFHKIKKYFIKKRIKCGVSRNENVQYINRKHKLNDIPDNVLSDTELLDSLQDTINRIENALNVNNSVQSADDEFCVLVRD